MAPLSLPKPEIGEAATRIRPWSYLVRQTMVHLQRLQVRTRVVS